LRDFHGVIEKDEEKEKYRKNSEKSGGTEEP